MSFYKQKWFFCCLAVAFICALASYLYYDSYPELVARTRRGTPISGLAIGTLGFFILSLPLIVIAALVRPRASTVMTAQIHAAGYISFLFLVSFASGSPGHSSPGSSFASVIEAILYAILGFELVMIAAANSLRKRLGHPAAKISGTFLCITIVITLIGGWFTGVALWSLKLPSIVLAAAKVEAQEKPYCIVAANTPVHSKMGLNALNMYAHDDDGYTWYFHGLLVIGEGANRKYMNWSYREGKFNPIGDGVRKSMNLDNKDRCTPVLNFGESLPLIGLTD